MSSLEILEVKFDVAHLLLYISVGDDGMYALDELLLIIQCIEQDGYLCLEGDVVETHFPVGIGRAGSFGRNAQLEVFGLHGFGSQMVSHAGVLGTPYGNAAQLLEQRTQWPEEPFFFHEEITLHADSPAVEQPYEKIHVAGVWSQADDELVRMWLRNVRSPSHSLEEHPFAKCFDHEAKGLVQIVDLVDNLIHIVAKVLCQNAEIFLGRYARFNM